MTPAQGRPMSSSTDQPQHDNDRRHIPGIKIMPTYREVVSEAQPYMSTTGPTSQDTLWNLPRASDRFDRLFRLLREESIGQVRDACREVLQAASGPGFETYSSQQTSSHFHVCDNAKIRHIGMHEEDGLELIVALKQPEQVLHLSERQRQNWWAHCNRFRSGTLVCVLDHAGYILHFVVPSSAPRLPGRSADGLPVHTFTLSGDSEHAYVKLRLVDSSQASNALRWYKDKRWTHYLLDFPGITLASFRYTLEALQRDWEPQHPLVNVLCHDSSTPRQSQEVSLPEYAQTTGFAFNLDCLMQGGQSFQFRPVHAPTMSEARSLVDLRPAQAMALLESLSRKVALIGGLPESGKSYLARKIIKVLLHNRETAGIGPIVFMFHEDAALDQMINLLLEDGIESIVRMGGPSTSERLQNLNLPVTSCTELPNEDRMAENLTRDVLHTLVWDIRRQLSLYNCGLPDTYPELISELTRSNDNYERNRLELQTIYDGPRRRALREAHVVAVTTTELARHPELLQSIHAKVLLCDDADEFQESHLLTAILPATEHIILIGTQTSQSERAQGISWGGSPGPRNPSFFERLVNHAPRRFSSLSLVRNPRPIDEPPSESPSHCGRNFPGCSHSCQLPLHGGSECGPCNQVCDVRCPHSQCTMPCAAPCNWIPCSRRCMLLLDCGHQCPSICGEACPAVKYCQTCCPEEDLLMTPLPTRSGMEDYRDVNLDEDPCIFPPCGHFQTRSFMDWQLRIRDSYNLGDDGLPSSTKGTVRPFSTQEVPCCIRCRSSLHDIRRYGRITRGPLLDGPLKEFLAWRNGRFSELIDRLGQSVPALNWYMAYRGLPSTALVNQNASPIELSGNMLHQLHSLNDLVGQGRYADMIVLFLHIRDFSFGELRPREGIFQRVAGSTRQADGNGNSRATRQHESLFQLAGDLYAMDLLLRCNIVVLDDFLRLWRRNPAASTNVVSRPGVRLELLSNLRGCQTFIRQAQDADQRLIAAQGHVCFAWYCGFALALGEDASTQGRRPDQGVVGGSEFPVSQEEFRRSAEAHLAEAERLHKQSLHASRRLKEGIEATADFVRSRNQGSLRVPGTLWYTNVVGTFTGTGPWYVCDNGHPFMDVRRPSMFLGQLRCTDCGMIVAGRQHASEEETSPEAAAAVPPQEVKLIDI